MSPPVFTRPLKASIAQLPIYNAIGLANIEVITNVERAVSVVTRLSNANVLGFDTESKPRFKKGEPELGPHLLQFALPEQAYIFASALPDVFELGLQVVANRQVCKVGFGLKDDNRLLVNRYGQSIHNKLDISRQLAPYMSDEKPIGARPAVAMLLGMQLSKSAQMSNWGRWPLSNQQVLYAGLDAHSALAVWQKAEPLVRC